MMKRYSYLFVFLAVLLTGCSDEAEQAQPSAAAPQQPNPQSKATGPAVDETTLALGKKVFDNHCASCHGGSGQGADDWQKPGPDGKYPAPPLNGTGHAWHHPMAALQQTIRNGTARIGGNMPAWENELSDEEINAVIYWFQSQWPVELYGAWREADARARSGAGN